MSHCPQRPIASSQPVTVCHTVPSRRSNTLCWPLAALAGLQIRIDYSSGAAPPELPPLLATEQEDLANVFLLGLEVPPIYRDPQSGAVIPTELRALTARLGRALRQSFYVFAHSHARYRPAHFHELGPRAMTGAVGEVDKGLSDVGNAFDLILHATPVNADAAFERFLAARCDTVPEFLYRPQTVDHGALKYALYKVPIEHVEDPALYHLFAAQRDELDRQITMLADRDTPRFLLESQQVFGGPSAQLTATARHILEEVPAKDHQPSMTVSISAADFACRAEQELTHYREAWPELPARVELRNDVPGIMVSRGHLLIGETSLFGTERIEATLHHEIGTHIVTYYNGLKQPLSQFHAGMPGYEETQEGIAVLSEYLCGGLTPSRLRLLAGRVVAVDSLVRGADFVETFRLLEGVHGFGKRIAFTISMRVHRGGGLTKDIVYLRGLLNLLDHLSEDHEFEDLLLGKIALQHIEIVEELRWRQVIAAGPLRPRYLADPASRKRLANLPSSGDIVQLVN